MNYDTAFSLTLMFFVYYFRDYDEYIHTGHILHDADASAMSITLFTLMPFTPLTMPIDARDAAPARDADDYFRQITLP